MTDPNIYLRKLPGVDYILEKIKKDIRFADMPRNVLLDSVRSALDKIRKNILANNDTVFSEDQILSEAYILAEEKLKPRLVPIINATGVVLHTNLGRALLCEDAIANISNIAGTYSNLELSIKTGKRGIRYHAVDELICELTGAESAIVVNNNAGAVLLCLNTLAEHTEVIVSRGELVEIGGSFRVPDVMAKSGCILKEVGTTNRTHVRDYINAINEKTGLLLKVHTSNYRIDGFTASVSAKELATLGHEKNIPVMEDLGSGTLIDFSSYGMPKEPTVGETVRAGVDVITFSGDKLLGGPQSGIIIGKKQTLERIGKNPLTRALRIDKLTLAALESTLKLYLDEENAIRTIPTLKMLTMTFTELCLKAEKLFNEIKNSVGAKVKLEFADLNSRPGGGSFPELDLPTRCVSLKPLNLSVSNLEKAMRLSCPAIIGRIVEDFYIMDPRTILHGQESIIALTLARIMK